MEPSLRIKAARRLQMWLQATKQGPDTKTPLERWMWVFLESGTRPEWAHKGIDNQDLRDIIATAIRSNMK